MEFLRKDLLQQRCHKKKVGSKKWKETKNTKSNLKINKNSNQNKQILEPLSINLLLKIKKL